MGKTKILISVLNKMACSEVPPQEMAAVAMKALTDYGNAEHAEWKERTAVVHVCANCNHPLNVYCPSCFNSGKEAP